MNTQYLSLLLDMAVISCRPFDQSRVTALSEPHLINDWEGDANWLQCHQAATTANKNVESRYAL